MHLCVRTFTKLQTRMANQSTKDPGSLLKTVLIGLLIIFSLALVVGTLSVVFP
ncbi:hypothetical protein GCM10028825_08750 [Spirosoma agri]